MIAVTENLESIYPVPRVPDAGERAFCDDVGHMSAPEIAAEFRAAELRLLLDADPGNRAWLRRRIAALFQRQRELRGAVA
jgi:hypothetical protein